MFVAKSVLFEAVAGEPVPGLSGLGADDNMYSSLPSLRLS